MVGEQNVFEQPVKNDTRRYQNVEKIANGQGDKMEVQQLFSLLKKQKVLFWIFYKEPWEYFILF